MIPAQKFLLGVCFFVSGATSLVLQVAWTKELSYILGNSLYSVATVVAAFMAGLGVGSHLASILAPRIERPIRAYALVQLAIAALGALSIFVFRSTEPVVSLLYATVPDGGPFLLARFLLVFAIMLVPVTLMGATLPIIVGALARAKASYALEAGLAYGVNTLGAVAGTWVAAFFLIQRVGLAGATLTAAAVDATVALVALGLDRRAGAIPAVAALRGRWRPRQWLVGTAFFLSGAVAMVLEVAWFRTLGLAMGPTVYVFAAMLGTFLLGVGSGSILFAPWAKRARLGGVPGFALLEVLLGGIVLAGMQILNALPRWNFEIFIGLRDTVGPGAFVVSHIALAWVVVFLPCLVMGAIFPFAVRAIRETGDPVAPELNVGRLYLLNTAGGIGGSLVAGFFLLPAFGIERTLIAAGIASCTIGGGLLLLGPAAPRIWLVALPVTATMALALAVLVPRLDVRLFNLGLYREVYTESRYDRARMSQELLFYSEGINAPVAVFNTGLGLASLRVSGKTDASTGLDDVRTQYLLGHLTALFAPDDAQMAVIGYGCGATLAAVLAHPFVRSVDVLEIERGVVDASPLFECVNDDPLSDPRTNLIVEDGRVHVMYSGSRYDAIVSEPSNPWMAGVANLFTVEFYEHVRERLTPGGVFGQWIQTYEVSAGTFRSMLATVTSVFPHTLVFSTGPGDLLVLGSKQPIRVPLAELRSRFEAESARATFARVGIDDPLELAFYLYGSPGAVERFAGSARLNTDDNVALEYRMPVDLLTPRGPGAEEIPARLEADRALRSFARAVPGLPLPACAEAVISHLYDAEPLEAFPNTFAHPFFEPVEGVLTANLTREAGASGDPSLESGVAQWIRQGRARLNRRIRGTLALIEAVGEGREGDFELLASVLETSPELPWALVLMGRALLREEAAAQALRRFESAMARPTSPFIEEARIGAALATEMRGDLDAARRMLEEASARNPYDPSTFEALAGFLLRHGDTAGAREALARGLRFNPDHPSLLRAGASFPPRG